MNKMSKEREALELLEGLPTNIHEKTALEIVKKALTPPTSDEICQGLHCEYEDGMFYKEGEWGIQMVTDDFTGKKYLDFDGLKLTLKQIIRIAQFYQKLEETKNE